jgi:hypothetical protein
MVTAVVNGKRELVSVSIKPEAVDPEDVEMLKTWSSPRSMAHERRRGGER